MKVENKK